MVDLVERIDALLKQEAKLYSDRSDYLSPWFQQKLLSATLPQTSTPSSSHCAITPPPSRPSDINEKWREVMCEWCFRVVDHFHLSRETVTIAMYYLDRYLTNHAADKKKFQLAAMTSLYLANKLYGHRILPMKHLLELSGGSFTKNQMTVAERAILETCQWHVHPPTAICFVQHMLFLFPLTTTGCTSLSVKARHSITEHARFLTELATLDYYMCLWFQQSEIALAALLNAIEDHHLPQQLPPEHVCAEVWRQLATFAPYHLSPFDPHIEAARQRLRILLGCQQKQEHHHGGDWDVQTISMMTTRPSPTSPVCVSYVCDMPSD